MHYTAQVKGSTKIIVTVVATRELEPGDVLRRFKAAQDGPTRSSRSSNDFCMELLSIACWCFVVVDERARLCVDAFFLTTFDILHKLTAWFEGRCISEQENIIISKRLDIPQH